MNVLGTVKKVSLGGFVAGALIFVSSFSVTGCLTDSKDKDSTTTPPPGTHALSTEMALSVGAQAHATYGSVIDIDSGKTWKSAVANANQAGIDLVFLYYGSALHMEDAVAARASGVANSINLTNTYDVTKIQHVDILMVSTKPTNQEALETAFDAGSANYVHTSVVKTGDMFIVESTGGKLSLVTITSVSGTEAGTADVKLSINSI
ncbi:MAG: hypothetical protein ABIY63_07825 [Fibrobacteria bacterium]